MMLKQGDGSFACVAESATRFTLGEVNISVYRSLLCLSFLADLDMSRTLDLYGPFCFLLYLNNVVDQGRTAEGPRIAGGTRKLTSIPPKRIQGFPPPMYPLLLLFFIFK